MSEHSYTIASVLFSLILLYLVATRVNFENKKQQINLIIWAVIFAVVFAIAYLTEEPKFIVNSANQGSGYSYNNLSTQGNHITIRSKIARNGAYYLQASVNGHYRSEFLVDTGATISIISKDTAHASGINIDLFKNIVVLQTANGKMNARCGLANIVIEPLTFKDLEVCVAMHDNLDKDILGTNFLDRFDSYRFSKNTLELIIDPKN